MGYESYHLPPSRVEVKNAWSSMLRLLLEDKMQKPIFVQWLNVQS
jgi:hypothetical protein